MTLLETPEPLAAGTGVHMQAVVSSAAGCSDSTGLYLNAKCWSQGQECGYSYRRVVVGAVSLLPGR